MSRAEELTLLVADNRTGYFGVNLAKPGCPKPYQARVSRGGKQAYLGRFATAEEAALHVARSPEGQAIAAERAAAAPALTSEEARQQAQAERLTPDGTAGSAPWASAATSARPAAARPSGVRATCSAASSAVAK